MSTEMDTPEPSIESPARRQFCAHACQAVSLLAVGAFAGCSGGNPTSPSQGSVAQAPAVAATVSGRVVSISVDSAAALSAVGSGALAQTSVGTFLVARTGPDTFTALSANCTHDACIVSGYSSGRFVCPCHGSQFTTAGAVVTGPARSALRQYTPQLANGVLTFSV